nr:reverse transcriptase domain-containing protein [Tanacetum cinerariifolium]
MSTNEQTPLSQPTSAVRNTLGKEQTPQDLVRPISDEALREYRDKNYHQILPIIAEKVHQEHVQQEKLKAVKSRLNFEELSRHSESGTPSRRRSLKERLGHRHARTTETLKAATRVLALEKQKLVSRNIVTKENPREKRKNYQKESIDSYNDLRKTSLENYLQKKKCIKDPVEIHNIKQREGECTEEFVRSKNPDKGKTSRREASGTNKGRSKSKTNSPSSQRHQKNFGSGQREVQASSANDETGNAQGMKVVTSNQGAEAKQWKRSSKGSQKEKNLWKRQATTITNEKDGTEGPMIIEAEIGGHCVHRMYVDGCSSLSNLYEHCFNRFRPEISLLVKIGDEERSTFAWMNLWWIFSLEFTMVSGPGMPQPVINQVAKEKIQVAIHPEYPKETIAIGSTLKEERRKELCGLLRRNFDIFAWRPTDMTGVSRHIAEHRLNVREGSLPVRQKKRGQPPERSKAICEEVEKLVEVDIMKEVHYHSWLSNTVMWIRLSKSTFGRNLEVYVDDLVIKIRKEKEVIRDTEGTFKTLWEINMKLNPKKYAFEMREGTFLGYKVDAGGLRRCTKKSDFQWTVEAETAFKKMKKLIAELPMLTEPKEKEEMIMYLAAAKEAISAVLMTETDRKQMLIYFVSHALQDFIVERSEEDPLDILMADKEELSDLWVLFTDESSCIDASGAGLIITNPKGVKFTCALRLRFNTTNNEVEYESLVAGLRIAEQMGVKKHSVKYEKEILAAVEEEGHTWLTLIYEYLTKEILLEEKGRHELYAVRQENYVLREIHEGSCSMHVGPRSVVAKALRSGDNPFKDWCEKLCIRQCFASVKHPQANDLVERANRSLGEGIKARLDERSKNWLEKISHVLWAHRTMIQTSNRETPFSLTCGTEAVIPVEIGMPTLRNAEEAKSKAKMEKYYNARVRSTSFRSGDLVYQSNEASRTKDEGKLGPKWEGPYEVTEALGKGAYKLRDYNRNNLLRT